MLSIIKKPFQINGSLNEIRFLKELKNTPFILNIFPNMKFSLSNNVLLIPTELYKYDLEFF